MLRLLVCYGAGMLGAIWHALGTLREALDTECAKCKIFFSGNDHSPLKIFCILQTLCFVHGNQHFPLFCFALCNCFSVKSSYPIKKYFACCKLYVKAFSLLWGRHVGCDLAHFGDSSGGFGVSWRTFRNFSDFGSDLVAPVGKRKRSPHGEGRS